MKASKITVQLRDGLHARIAAEVVRTVSAHQATVTIQSGSMIRADATSILQLLALGAAKGAELVVEVDGPDEDTVTDALVDIFQHGGGI
jgi:phosphotransferase system HPr (HPr) family protein